MIAVTYMFYDLLNFRYSGVDSGQVEFSDLSEKKKKKCLTIRSVPIGVTSVMGLSFEATYMLYITHANSSLFWF